MMVNGPWLTFARKAFRHSKNKYGHERVEVNVYYLGYGTKSDVDAKALY